MMIYRYNYIIITALPYTIIIIAPPSRTNLCPTHQHPESRSYVYHIYPSGPAQIHSTVLSPHHHHHLCLALYYLYNYIIIRLLTLA